jgi:hypothetical protein
MLVLLRDFVGFGAIDVEIFCAGLSSLGPFGPLFLLLFHVEHS